jgi:hypothetical protein
MDRDQKRRNHTAEDTPVRRLGQHGKARISSALGLVEVSIATLLLGTVGIWYQSVFWFVLVVATVVYFPRKRFALNWHNPLPVITPLKEWWTKCAFGLLAIATMILIVGALAPETFYDSLHYHLGVPNLYLLNHRIYNEPNFAYASFVMVVQFFWGFALTVGNEITVKILHGAMLCLLFFAFVAFERRYLASFCPETLEARLGVGCGRSPEVMILAGAGF